MVDKLARSIEGRAQIAFQKVKDDILFLNNRIEIIDKSMNKHIKDSNLHTNKELISTIENLIKRVEKLEKENSNLKTKSNKVESSVDDLTKVEGIGPVISKVLRKNEIFTFQDLSKSTIKLLKSILEENNLQQHDPTTWPKQAKLAHNEEWSKLDIWQEELKGGRV